MPKSRTPHPQPSRASQGAAAARLGLLALLLAGPASATGDWQQDLLLEGAQPTEIRTYSLRATTDGGIELLVGQNGGLQYIARVDSSSTAATWRAADGVYGLGFPTLSAAPGGWLHASGRALIQPIVTHCSLALRLPDGRIGAEVRDLPIGDCHFPLFDASGVVIPSSVGAIALAASGTELWRNAEVPVAPQPPARAGDGSVWLAGNGTGFVRRLDGASGAELARSPVLWTSNRPPRSLRGRADGGVQVVSSSSTSTLAQVLGPDGSVVAQAQLAPVPAATASSAAGIAACWYQTEIATPNEVHLHAAVHDPQLQLRWSQRLASYASPGGQPGQCEVLLSAAGRSAVVVSGLGRSELFRLRADGGLIDRQDGEDNASRMLYAADESLWRGQRPGLQGSTSTLLRHAADQPGVAQVVPLWLPGQEPRLQTLLPLADGAALVQVQDASARLHSFRVDPQGSTTLQLPPVLAAVTGGFVHAMGGELLRQDEDGSIRWRRPLQEPDLTPLVACAADGRCAFAERNFASGQWRVEWLDPAGQVLGQQALVNESVERLFHTQRLDALLLHSRTVEGANLVERLYRIDAPGPVQQLTVTRQFVSYSLLQNGHAQLVDPLGNGGYFGHGAAGLQWQFQAPAAHELVRSAANDFWQRPDSARTTAQPRLGPLNGNGQLAWSVDASQWELGGPIAGLPERHAWLATRTAQGPERYAIRVLDADGSRLRRIDLPEARSPVLALTTADGDESALIAYASSVGERPALRIRRIQHGLFRDGLED